MVEALARALSRRRLDGRRDSGVVAEDAVHAPGDVDALARLLAGVVPRSSVAGAARRDGASSRRRRYEAPVLDAARAAFYEEFAAAAVALGHAAAAVDVTPEPSRPA